MYKLKINIWKFINVLALINCKRNIIFIQFVALLSSQIFLLNFFVLCQAQYFYWAFGFYIKPNTFIKDLAQFWLKLFFLTTHWLFHVIVGLRETHEYVSRSIQNMKNGPLEKNPRIKNPWKNGSRKNCPPKYSP